MKQRNFLFIVFLLCTLTAAGQPVWSPQVRANRETDWMRDSLSLSAEQLQKIKPISLKYQQEMDKSNGNDKKQHELMKEKDRSLQSILNKEQYKKYYRREEEIRSRPKPNYKGPHQPY